MDYEYESPFLDRDMPWFTPEQESAEPVAEVQSPFTEGFVHEDSPFLSGESDYEAEAAPESESDPSLFDPADLARELEASDGEWNSEAWINAESVSDELRTFEDAGVSAESFWGAQREAESEAEAGQGETVMLSGEDEWASESSDYEDSGEGEVVFLNEADTWNEVDNETPASTPVLARILWPALGFPAVIAPTAASKAQAGAMSDATRCITVLLLSNRKNLSKAEAAQYLRIVPWKDRARRHIAAGSPGSFREGDLAVRNDETRSMNVPNDRLNKKREQILSFGADQDGMGGCEVMLSAEVRRIYASYGLKYLHEIRVSEEVCARLPATAEPYHLFWNNQSAVENAPSDEMRMLLQRFAKPRRQAEGARWQNVLPQLLMEYENEYGTMHLPNTRKPVRRAEILHPVFIRKQKFATLRIGHVTDLHVDVRNDVYEYNLSRNPSKPAITPQFNNWNTSSASVYSAAKGNSDIVLMTGDLIDYGRGHMGIAAKDKLGDNAFYHRDRNWFLFYDMLAAGDRYTRPVYTSLGNHDWRLNPYPPFAIAGAPSTPTLFHNYTKYSDAERKVLLQVAHGEGYKQLISYDPRWHSFDVAGILKKIPLAVKGSATLDEPGLPTHTDVDSVLWYLLQINPFLDYAWSLPGNYRALMLDWAEDEAVLFPMLNLGRPFTVKTSIADFEAASGPGPMAKNSLSPTQVYFVKQLVGNPSPAKIIGIHAPPIAPYTDWTEAELAKGVKSYASKAVARGPMNYGERKNGKVTAYNGHPMFAVEPPGDLGGMVADYNSFQLNREWFVKTMADTRSRVRIVFAGHIHRNGLFGVRIGTKADGVTNGQYLVASLQPGDVAGNNGPAIAPKRGAYRAPLYLNTTSAGLRGNFIPGGGRARENVGPGYSVAELAASGAIVGVAFKAVTPMSVRAVPVPVVREAADSGGWG